MDYFADFGMLALSVGAIAVATEAVTEGVKAVVKTAYVLTAAQLFYISLCIGIFLAVSLQVSLFNEATVPTAVFFVGQALAGAIASRGANRAHEILDMLRAIKSGK